MTDFLSNGLHKKVMIVVLSKLDAQFAKKISFAMIIGQQMKKALDLNHYWFLHFAFHSFVT